jgi:CRISPR system Cascade subunit CasB
MNEPARSFINHLQKLSESNRGALAHLKRSLSFAPGAYPPAFPHVERFVGAERHADDPWRQALYLAAGLYPGTRCTRKVSVLPPPWANLG